MGLDMYLLKGKRIPKRSYKDIKYDQEVGYWRKANAIHKYFVDTVQKGYDDQGVYHVTKAVLRQLLRYCEHVKENSELVERKLLDGNTVKVIKDSYFAEKYLPTQDGFFFGSTSYDEWYLENIDNTIKIIKDVLANTDFSKEAVAYHAWW